MELAHRIGKRQFTLGSRSPHQFSSLKHAWARALVANENALDRGENRPSDRVPPRLHQNSGSGALVLTETQIQTIKPVRYSRSLNDGQGLFPLVTPTGGLHWRFRYRFAGRRRTLALRSYPVITLDWARSRHALGRHMLLHRIDPADLKAALGKLLFVITMREWQISQGHQWAFSSSIAEGIMAARRSRESSSKLSTQAMCASRGSRRR